MKRRCNSARDLKVVSQNQVISEHSQEVRTRSSFRIESNMALIFELQPECVNEALQDPSWIDTMQEKLNQFRKSKVWTLVPLPKGHYVIGIRWLFRNTLDEVEK